MLCDTDNNLHVKPLKYPDGWPDPPSKLELLLRWIPVIGWLAGAVLEHLRLNPGETAVQSQFTSRAEIAPDYWKSDAHRQIAHAVINSCVKACNWPHAHFIPEDPIEIMIMARTGRGEEWDAVFRIEKAVKIELKPELVSMTLGELVDYVISHRKC